MKVIAKLLPAMQETKMPLATFHHVGYTMYAITPEAIATMSATMGAFKGDPVGIGILGKISPNAKFVRDLDKVELETDSTTGFVIFHGDKKYPHGRCSAHNAARDGEYVKIKHPDKSTYH